MRPYFQNSPVQTFKYGLLTDEEHLPKEWTFFTSDYTDFEAENIYCHELKEIEKLLLQGLKQSYSKAMVLINSTNRYDVSSELICDFRPPIPTVVVSKSDGQNILNILDEHKQVEVMFITANMRKRENLSKVNDPLRSSSTDTAMDHVNIPNQEDFAGKILNSNIIYSYILLQQNR